MVFFTNLNKKMLSDRESKSIDEQSSSNNTTSNEITPNKNYKTKQTKSSRKRKRRHSSTDEEELDTTIDLKLKESAMRNNLTPQNVKNILQKVVRNDHVLAIVKLREEELERQEQAMKESKWPIETCNETITAMDIDEIDDGENAVPKLTRAKAKALNKFPLPVAPIKHSEPDSEVIALIREELHSDDDDDEYQPGEEDIESDDDANTTTSDIDSQPATPSSQVDPSDEPQSPTVYTKDGLFKIPRARTESATSQTEQEYIIAQRTRSKISLAETPIEAIESTFKAPDAPLDMYQTDPDVDVDDVWIQFLRNFGMPLTTDAEKDEDADPDPDYCPKLVDFDDREEFQHVNVSKKEVNDLLNELYNSLPEDILKEITDAIASDALPQKQMTSVQHNGDLNDMLITPIKRIEQTLTTPEPNKNESQTQPPIASPEPSNSMNISYFDPNAISTPAKPNLNENNISPITQQQQQQHQQSFDSFNSTLLQINESSTQYSYQYPTYSLSPLEAKSPVLIPVVQLTTNSTVTPIINPMPYSSFLITAPCESITTPAMPATVISSSQIVNREKQIEQLNRQIQGGPAPKKIGCRAKRARFKSASFKELEHLDPKLIQPHYFYSIDERGFTPDQRQILETQLRMHVQIATQNYIQTYGHPELYSEAFKAKKLLIELDELVDKKYAKPIHNLKPALQLITKWENELSINTKENTELVKHIQDEMNKLRKNMSYIMRFHERILNLISESEVFIHPDLLPSIPFRFKTTKPSEYVPAEDFLLSFLLEHFFIELQSKMDSYKFAKPRDVTLTSVCQHISAHLGYIRHWKSIYDYIRLRRDHQLINPIKYKLAPPVRHRIEKFDPRCVIEPAKQPVSLLPTQFAQHVEKLIGRNHDRILNSNINKTIEHSEEKIDWQSHCQRQRTLVPEATKQDVLAHKSNDSFNVYDNNSLIQIKILYKSNVFSESISQCFDYQPYQNDVNENNRLNDSVIKGQTLLTSYYHPVKKNLNILNNQLENTDHDDSIKLVINCDISKTDKKHTIWHGKRIRKKYLRFTVTKYLIRRTIIEFLVYVARKSRKQSSVEWRQLRNKNVSFVFMCIVLYNRFVIALRRLRRTNRISSESYEITTETIAINRRVQKLLNDKTKMRETQEEIALNTNNQNDAGGKRLPKNQRTSDNSRILLLTENAQESSEKDFVFAQRFLDRVEETFINENKHHKFAEFLAILRNFSDNQHKQSGADLYLILEKFMPEYPDLVDLFLYFLTPSDAVEINKSMDYFLKLNFSKFLNKLNVYFQKQPAQIRKVVACLREMSEESDVTIERIRSRILPLLKGNPLLIEWFLQCVGPDKCESLKEEYETLVLRKTNESFDDDQFEYIPQSEILPDPNDNPCHIRYLNGRLFYGNRFPLPAKLSFGAMPCSTVSNNLTDTDRHLLIGGDDKTLSYKCVHNIKEFADNKMRDRHQSELESSSHVGISDELDNASDDDQNCMVSADKIDEKNSCDDENEHTLSSTAAVNENTLCDNTLLRAHSIRLNPSLHTSMMQSNAELLNKLKSLDQISVDVSKELRLSPKKQSAAKCTPNTQPKASQIRKTGSPNARKLPAAGCRSPNNKKTVTTSSLLSTPDTMDGGSTIHPSQDSNAIQTAKKLKRFLESSDSSQSSNQSIDVDDSTKRSSSIGSNSKTKSSKSHMLSKPIKKQKRAHDFNESGDEDENTECNLKKNYGKIQNDSDNHKKEQQQQQQQQQKDSEQLEIQWTREEDRLLLEQIRAGFDSNSESISGFVHRFPNKTQENIRDRIDFLIDFLTKLRNKQ